MKINNLNTKLITWLAILGFSIAALAACGPSEETDEDAETETTEAPDAEDAPEEPETMAMEPDQTVDLHVIAMGETMAEIDFDQEEISVPSNAKVNFTLENQSQAAGMSHNFVVVKTDQLDEVVEAGLDAGPQDDFIPDHEGVVAASPLASPGETVNFEFNTPEEAGTYTFICLYPGHVDAMQGTFIVE